MFALQMAFQRKRKFLLRLGALIALGLGALAVVLPGVGTRGTSSAVVAQLDRDGELLFPAPISSEHFSDFYSHPIQSASDTAGS